MFFNHTPTPKEALCQDKKPYNFLAKRKHPWLYHQIGKYKNSQIIWTSNLGLAVAVFIFILYIYYNIKRVNNKNIIIIDKYYIFDYNVLALYKSEC
jgi:hypothetical protein